MKREILISATQREVRVAILEDDQLVELQVERPETRRMVGDIYWGKVESVLPGLQAALSTRSQSIRTMCLSRWPGVFTAQCASLGT